MKLYFHFTYWRNTYQVTTLLLIFCCPITAQTSLRNFTEIDGLPSSEVYDVLQAKDGSMWFATDRGVSNYNGYEFVNYSIEESMTSNVIYEMLEDQKGRIWFLSNNNRISYWEDGHFVKYPFSNILDQIQMSQSFLHSFYVDVNDNVYLGTRGHGLVKISKEGHVTMPHDDGSCNFDFIKLDNVLLSFSNKVDLETTSLDYLYENELIGSFGLSMRRTKALSLDDNLLCLNVNKTVILYDSKAKKIIDKAEFDRWVVFIKWIDEKLYVGLESGGLQVFKQEKGKLIKTISLLENVTCSNLAVDDQQGLWITTIEKGIFYCLNLNIKSYTKENGLHRNYIKYLSGYNGKLVIGYGESYQFLEGNNLSAVENISQSDPLQRRLELEVLSNDVIVSKLDCTLYMGDTRIYDECSKFIFPHPIGSGFQVKSVGEDLYFCARHQYLKYSNGEITDYNFERFNKIINDIEYIENDTFWVGFRSGLSKIVGSELIDYTEKNPLFSNWIVDMVQTKKHGLILGTREVGILFYKDDKVRIVDTSSGLVSNDIIRLYVDSDETIWVATNKGLHRIDPDDYTKIDFINTSDGILSNEIKDMCRIEDNLFIGTKMGLSVIDLKTFRKQNFPTEVTISNIILNKDTLKNKSTLDIYKRHKYLEINYLGINYPSQNDIQYKYRIQGLSDTWYYTKDRQIKLFSFPEKGNATLELYAKTGFNAEWNEKPIILNLRFHPPFYKKWEFRFGLLSLLALLIYAGFKVNLLSYNRLIQQELYNRLLERLKKNSYLIIKINTENIRISYNDILFIKSSKDYVEIYTRKNKYLYRTTMKKMELELSDLQFMRVHRSYIVRKDKIDSISSDQLVVGNSVIPIGKTYKALLKEFAIQFSRLNK